MHLQGRSLGHLLEHVEERRLLDEGQHLEDVVAGREFGGVHDALLVLASLLAHDQRAGQPLLLRQLDVVAQAGVALEGVVDLPQDAIVLG